MGCQVPGIGFNLFSIDQWGCGSQAPFLESEASIQYYCTQEDQYYPEYNLNCSIETPLFCSALAIDPRH